MTNAEAWFSIALRPRKPEGWLGRTAQDGHLDSHTARTLPTLSLFNPNREGRVEWVDGGGGEMSIAFWHLPPNSARFSYANEGALFISAQLSSDVVSALRKVRVLI